MKKTLSFMAGLILALLMMLLSVLGPALRTDLFENALLATVNRQAVGAEDEALAAFAAETMAYLRGEKALWEPQITLYGFAAEEAIPPSFRQHMAEVRGWIAAAPWVLGIGFVLAAVLLAAGGRRRTAFWGVYAALGLLLALLCWAALDFDSLWMVIHRLLIPGGIFSAREPVMQLFPLALFFRYIQPVCLSALGHFGALFAGLWLAMRIRGLGRSEER